MNNKYRVDWQAGMRLTDEIFRSADEYYLSCLQPLYSVLVNGDYGFLSLPIFRYELSDVDYSTAATAIPAIVFAAVVYSVSATAVVCIVTSASAAVILVCDGISAAAASITV